MMMIDEILTKIYKECSEKWLEKYNQFSGKTYDYRDMSFINDFTPKNPTDTHIMQMLQDGLEILLRYGFVVEDETEEMKLKQKSELEMLKEKLNQI